MKKSESSKKEAASPNAPRRLQKSQSFLIENQEKLKALAEKLEDDYLLTLFEAESREDSFKCLVCKTSVLHKNIKRHLSESITHKNKLINEVSLIAHNNLIEKFQNNRISARKVTFEEGLERKKNYLEFVGACFKAKLSFRQISHIAKYLKEMQSHGKLNFLQSFSFLESDISKVANVWGDYLSEELEKDLNESKYSLCVDNSTIGKKSICALEVRYLKKELDQNQELRTRIQNRIVGIKYLEDSSTGETLFRIVKEKLLTLSEQIRNNLSYCS